MRSKPEKAVREEVYFRQTSPLHAPLWHLPSPIQPAYQPEHRFNEESLEYVQYFASNPEAAWAEHIRAEELHEPEDLLELRRAIYAFSISEHTIADLSDLDKAERCEAGLAEALVGDGHGDLDRCRELALELRDAGYRGLLAPSAALPGATTLALFGPRAELLVDQLPAGTGAGFRASTTIPCVRIAIGAPASTPPDATQLLSKIRHHGEDHSVLQAWLKQKG